MTNISAVMASCIMRLFLKASTFSFETHWYLIVMSSGTNTPSTWPNSDVSFKPGAVVGFEL